MRFIKFLGITALASLVMTGAIFLIPLFLDALKIPVDKSTFGIGTYIFFFVFSWFILAIIGFPMWRAEEEGGECPPVLTIESAVAYQGLEQLEQKIQGENKNPETKNPETKDKK